MFAIGARRSFMQCAVLRRRLDKIPFESPSTSLLNQLNVFNELHHPDDNDTENGAALPSITRCHDRGFTVGNIQLVGGLVLLDGGVFMWDVKQHSDLSVEHFSLFKALKHKCDLLLIGTGRQMHPLPQDIAEYLQSCGIAYEVLPSRRAASTYNVLVEEDRNVACALLPNAAVSARELNDGSTSKDTDKPLNLVNK